MNATTDAHVHEHQLLELELLTYCHKKYKGTSGDKALLFRKCECGDALAIEYGPTEAMRELLSELEARS
jgi:hypothetical protein